MLTLYDYLPSQNAWKVRLLLKQLGRQYTHKYISIFEGEGREDWYLAINPTGAVPAIELDDGNVIAESNAILVYLAEDTDLLPSEPVSRARVFQWLFFESDYVQSSIATLRHWVLTGKDKARSAELLRDKISASNKVLKILDRSLENSAFLIGEQYTIADIAVFSYVHLSEDAGLNLSEFPNVQQWIIRVCTQPEFSNKVYPILSIPTHTKSYRATGRFCIVVYRVL